MYSAYNRPGESFLPLYPQFVVLNTYLLEIGKKLLKIFCVLRFSKGLTSSVVSEVLLPCGFNEF